MEKYSKFMKGDIMSTSDYFKNDLVRCHNKEKADVRFQDGSLRHAIGTHCFQVMRATQNSETSTDGFGWSYNHAAMLVYWNGRFYADYLSDPVSEHLPPSQTLIAWSDNGAKWSRPVVLFPPMEAPSAPYTGPNAEELTNDTVACVMHQRVSFYVTKDNHLLATGFYGIAPNHGIAPNNGYGVGRVVREIYEDNTFSDIYFLRFNEAGGYTKENTGMFPHFGESSDAAFISACEELLDDHLFTQQMWEEERHNTEWFTQPGAEALSYYTLPDGDILGFYKNSFVTKSSDGGKTWSEKETDYSIETATGKVWAQKTGDGRYALCYNPTTDSAHRWPIAVTTSDNGQDFDNLFAITPEVSPHKYAGLYKNLGPQYIRGICENNPKPDDKSLWLAYTVNKEDVWVSYTPVPVNGTTDDYVNTDFSDMPVGPFVEGFNVYSPLWCPVEVTASPTERGSQVLCLHDSDPYDRARAMKIFKESEMVKVSTRVYLDGHDEKANFTIELQEGHGKVPVRLYFKSNGDIVVKNGGRYSPFGSYQPGEWLDITITANCLTNIFTVTLKSGLMERSKNFRFSESVYTIERILFASKDILPFNTVEDCGKWGDLGNLEQADFKIPESNFYINNLLVEEWRN